MYYDGLSINPTKVAGDPINNEITKNWHRPEVHFFVTLSIFFTLHLYNLREGVCVKKRYEGSIGEG